MNELSAPGSPVLEARDVDFAYGRVQVLFGAGLEVGAGEVVALLGTNGAGKSTLLKVISGLVSPSSGEVRLHEARIDAMPAEQRVRRGVVQVPGGRAVFPGMSVAENLRVGAFTFRKDRARVRERTDDVLKLFPRLAERLEQPAGTLSGGEQQMLAIAKGLLLEPEVLLIDELSLGLAPVVVEELLGVVEQLSTQRRLSIVIVEQSVNIALSLAQRAVFMEKGQVRFEGDADDLLAHDELLRAVFLGGEGG